MQRSLKWLAISWAVLAPCQLNAQPGAGCSPQAMTCKGITNPALCAALQRRCGAGTGTQRPAPNAQDDQSADPSRQQGLTELPDCADNEELVMVPTCRCGESDEAVGAAAGNGGCTTCTDSGVRMACEKIR